VALLVLVHRSASIAGRSGQAAWVALPFAGLLISPVGNQAFSAGQFAIVAAAASVVALSSTGTGTRSGVVSVASLACALALVKPQVGVPLLALLAVQRRWPVAVGGVGLAALLSAPVAAVLINRSGGFGNWIEVLRRNVELTAASPVTDGGRIGSTRVDVVGTLQRVGYDPSGTVVILITAVAALVTIGAAHLAWRAVLEAPDDVRARLAWWAAAAAAMLAWTPNELYSALVAVPALMLTATRQVGRVEPASNPTSTPRRTPPGWWLLPGLLLAVPFLHVHRVEDLLGLSRIGEPVNGLAVTAAAIAAAALARRTRTARAAGATQLAGAAQPTRPEPGATP
jgi:Glycosyltransferase family 87